MSLHMPPPTLLIGVLVVINLMLAHLVIQVVLRMAWDDLAARFPARRIGEGAVRRRFQSISLAGASLGPCVQIAVDGRWLHVRPGLLLWASGARGISVPWREVSAGQRRRIMGAERVELAIGDAVVTGPAWCLDAVPGSDRSSAR